VIKTTSAVIGNVIGIIAVNYDFRVSIKITVAEESVMNRKQGHQIVIILCQPGDYSSLITSYRNNL